MPQEIGDAVLRFIGDSTQLDTKFDEVQPNAEKAFIPAAEVVEEAGQRMKFSMHEAKGEVRLLGEAFGIHLPRHVSNFVATLPGVGEAMSAAFSATAILFIAEALVKATEKLSNFIGQTLIFTDAMRESNAQVEAENKALDLLGTQYRSAKEKLEELTGKTKDQEKAAIDLTHATVAEAKAELEALKIHIANKSAWDKTKDTVKDYASAMLGTVIPGYVSLGSATEDYIKIKEKEEAVTVLTAKAAKAETEEKAVQAEEKRQKAIHNQLAELENQKKIALAYTQNEQEKYEIELHFGEKKLALLRELGSKEKAQVQAELTQIEVLQIAHSQKISATFVNMLKMVQHAKEQALTQLKTVDLATVIELTPLQKAFKQAEDAAHSMGITIRTDYVLALEQAKKAQNDFASSGLVDIRALKAFQAEVKKAQKALHDYDIGMGHFKITEHGLFKQLQEDSKTGADALLQWKQIGANALSDITQSAAQAFSNLLLAQGSFGQALEKATAQVLASVASQALVTGIFDLAKSYEASARYDYGGAAQYTAAAETMFVVAALAGGGAAALSHIGGGGSGGSHNNAQGHDSVSNTGQSNRSSGSVSGVQAFAEGGLLTGPTIMLGGEAGHEAVLPLSDPRAMSEIGKAIAKHSGGGGGLTVHVHGGLVADNTLIGIMGKMSKLVTKGQARLLASDSHRLTKRSA